MTDTPGQSRVRRGPVVAASSGPLWRLSVDDAFGAIKAAGADGIEVMVTQSTETQHARELERLSVRHDLPIVAVHAPQLLLTRAVFTRDQVEKVKRTVQLCKGLDVGAIVLHPPYLWQIRYSLWLLHELEDLLAGETTKVTMENMYPIHVGTRRMSFHRFGSVASLDRFRDVTLDTSHLAVAEEDIVAAYRRLADRVVHVHLSDNRGKGRDSHAPLGEGILPVADFVRALDGPRLDSIALEVNPGAPAPDRDHVESVLGSNLEIVRSNLPAPRAS